MSNPNITEADVFAWLQNERLKRGLDHLSISAGSTRLYGPYNDVTAHKGAACCIEYTVEEASSLVLAKHEAMERNRKALES